MAAATSAIGKDGAGESGVASKGGESRVINMQKLIEEIERRNEKA